MNTNLKANVLTAAAGFIRVTAASSLIDRELFRIPSSVRTCQFDYSNDLGNRFVSIGIKSSIGMGYDVL